MPKKRRYLDEVPSGGFLRNYYRARHSDSYDDRARASEKAMMVAWGAAHTDNKDRYEHLLSKAGPMQNSFLLSGDDKDRYMLSHGYIKGTPGDYGLVRKAVGKRNLPVYQTSTDDIDRQYLVPIGNNMINPDWSEEDWRADRKAELKHPGSYPIAIYMDGRNPNDLYEKAWDLNDYKSGILNIMGYPAVQTTGYKRIPNERYNDLGYSRGPDYKDMRNNYLKTHGLEWNEIISQPSLPVVQVRARRLKDGGRIYTKPKNYSRFFGIATPEVTDNNIYYSRNSLLPEVKVVAKGDPRKVNNDYYKAHARARANAQKSVQEWDERDNVVSSLLLNLASIPLGVEGNAQLIKNLPEFVLNVPKNANRYYRYVGDDAIKDYIKTRTIRSSSANPNFNPPKIEGLLRRKKYDYNMFSKGEPWSGSLNASNKRKLNILVSKENTGKTIWQESNKDFGHKGHSGIYRPVYEGDLNATPAMYFDYYKPRLIGYTKHSLKDGGRIYIKPENRGKFTALKERTGHSASWFKENGTPAQKKMAVFALNSRKWKH